MKSNQKTFNSALILSSALFMSTGALANEGEVTCDSPDDCRVSATSKNSWVEWNGNMQYVPLIEIKTAEADDTVVLRNKKFQFTFVDITINGKTKTFGPFPINSWIKADLGDGDDHYNGKAMWAPQIINAGPGDDIIDGGINSDLIKGEAGNDKLSGNGGNDEIHGGDDNDLIAGNSGNDVIYAGANSSSRTITGDFEMCNKTLGFLGDGKGDIIWGCAGNDVIYLCDVNCEANGAAHGGSGNDTITGSNRGDHLWGGSGSDKIYGMGGIDDIFGESGKDYISGGKGFDRLEGGDGNDIFDEIDIGNDRVYDLANNYISYAHDGGEGEVYKYEEDE